MNSQNYRMPLLQRTFRCQQIRKYSIPKVANMLPQLPKPKQKPIAIINSSLDNIQANQFKPSSIFRIHSNSFCDSVTKMVIKIPLPNKCSINREHKWLYTDRLNTNDSKSNECLSSHKTELNNYTSIRLPNFRKIFSNPKKHIKFRMRTASQLSSNSNILAIH
jgi:hypothetical protein